MVDYEARFREIVEGAGYGDIKGHMGTLRRYASACRVITELGTHDGTSAFALLMGRPERLFTVDNHRQPEVEDLYDIARDLGVRFDFGLYDSRTCHISMCDLLFIDTYHHGDHLFAELQRHSPNVRKYILMHDTETFGDVGEDGGPGLWYGISAFLRGDDHLWRLAWHHQHCHGLTLLERR